MGLVNIVDDTNARRGTQANHVIHSVTSLHLEVAVLTLA
jgi:hypothetical protein